jgi:hypothetical protein
LLKIILRTVSISRKAVRRVDAGPMSSAQARRQTMRVMVFVKATEDSEKGIAPTAETTAMFEAMGKFNEELVDAGILLAGDGLKPSSEGKRVAFDGPGRTVIDGPFAETRELRVSGFGRCETWTKPWHGSGVVPIPCLDQARSRSGRCTKWPISSSF